MHDGGAFGIGRKPRRVICAADRRPLALGCFAAETRRQTNGRASYRGAARFNLRLRTGRARQIFSSGFSPRAAADIPSPAKTRAACSRQNASAAYARSLRRTIKVQAPLTSYSPTAEMQKQSPAAKGSSPRFHLKCPPPARTRSTSSPSVNSL